MGWADYTLAQVTGWLRAIDQDERARDRKRLLLLRAAQLDREGFEAVWEAL